MPATEEFLAKPQAFASQYALRPLLGTEDKSKLKRVNVDAGKAVYQVHGQNRVLYARVERDLEEQNLYNVEFSETQLTAEWFPVYWLPYQHNKTYRITLKGSKKTGLTANHFFTPNLTGCLVHVDGPPNEPTVYHSNAEKHTTGKSGADAKVLDVLHKIQTMQARIRAATTREPVGALNMTAYAPHSLSDEMLMSEAERLGKERSASFATMSQAATVFGVRDADSGNWTFYYQSLTKLAYIKGSMSITQWIVNRCDPFWP